MIAVLIDAWRRARPRSTRRVDRVVTVPSRAELPGRLHPQRLYLVGKPAKWALLHCPCGRGHDIDINLLNPGRRRWTVVIEEGGRPGLRPSVDVQGTDRCHFWLRNGIVVWCVD